MFFLYRGVNHRFDTLSMANTLTVTRQIGIPAAHGFDKFC